MNRRMVQIRKFETKTAPFVRLTPIVTPGSGARFNFTKSVVKISLTPADKQVEKLCFRCKRY
jgi:hypothetical protein